MSVPLHLGDADDPNLLDVTHTGSDGGADGVRGRVPLRPEPGISATTPGCGLRAGIGSLPGDSGDADLDGVGAYRECAMIAAREVDP